jgi:YD repeat-containing protein
MTSYTYDTDGNVVSLSRQLDADTRQAWQYTYNTFGQVLTATDPLGNTTTSQYDGNGNLLSVTTPHRTQTRRRV